MAPVLHVKLPITPPAVSVELPQLLTTVIDGAGIIEELGDAVALLNALEQPFKVCNTV